MRQVEAYPLVHSRGTVSKNSSRHFVSYESSNTLPRPPSPAVFVVCVLMIEEAFQGSKSHLGFEEPQGWSRQAVRRTAPLAMLLYSLTVLWFAQEGHALYEPPLRPWYRHKVHPSFADMLTTLRYACLRAAISANPQGNQGR